MAKDLKDKQFNIIVRTDSSNMIGIGHVMRCVLLALRLKERLPFVNILFFTQELRGNLNHYIKKSGFKVKSLEDDIVESFLTLAKDYAPKLVIIDSYLIDFIFEQKVKEMLDTKILAFDDTYEKHAADVILNHGLQADKTQYDSSACLLAGSKYTLIRDEFYKVKNNSKKNKTIQKILIILGGADIHNYSLIFVEILQSYNKSFNIVVATTSSNRNLNKLQTEQTHHDFQVIVDSSEIASLMADADLIISSVSTTLYEVIFLKKLFIAVPMAENQKPLESYLINKQLPYILSNIKSCILSDMLHKIEYNQEEIYQNLEKFSFSRDKLVDKILMELNI